MSEETKEKENTCDVPVDNENNKNNNDGGTNDQDGGLTQAQKDDEDVVECCVCCVVCVELIGGISQHREDKQFLCDYEQYKILIQHNVITDIYRGYILFSERCFVVVSTELAVLSRKMSTNELQTVTYL